MMYKSVRKYVVYFKYQTQTFYVNCEFVSSGLATIDQHLADMGQDKENYTVEWIPGCFEGRGFDLDD